MSFNAWHLAIFSDSSESVSEQNESEPNLPSDSSDSDSYDNIGEIEVSNERQSTHDDPNESNLVMLSGDSIFMTTPSLDTRDLVFFSDSSDSDSEQNESEPNLPSDSSETAIEPPLSSDDELRELECTVPSNGVGATPFTSRFPITYRHLFLNRSHDVPDLNVETSIPPIEPPDDDDGGVGENENVRGLQAHRYDGVLPASYYEERQMIEDMRRIMRESTPHPPSWTSLPTMLESTLFSSPRMPSRGIGWTEKSPSTNQSTPSGERKLRLIRERDVDVENANGELCIYCCNQGPAIPNRNAMLSNDLPCRVTSMQCA